MNRYYQFHQFKVWSKSKYQVFFGRVRIYFLVQAFRFCQVKLHPLVVPDFARVNLSSQSVSEMNFLLPMEGGGSVFLKEVAEGDLFKFPILGSNGAVSEIEITAEIIKRN